MIIKSKKGMKITLEDSHFLASGGEADIYVKDNIAYKIFQKERSSDFVNKLEFLQNLNKSNIIAPMDSFYNDRNSFIGYSMQYLKNTESMAKLFTKGYKTRNNISIDTLLSLIENLKKNTEFIHSKNCLIVDGNENNYLFKKDDVSIPYFIDIDSYQTKNCRATAFSPLITDPKVVNTKSFTNLSDWYSFAIITFQLLTNIHPFKGQHPDYSKKDVLLRMEKNISVFDSKTNLPASVEDFSVIPKELLSWYEDIFKNGKRTIPPNSFLNNAPIKPRETYIKGSNKLTIEEIKTKYKTNIFKNKDKYLSYYDLKNIRNNSNVCIVSENLFSELKRNSLETYSSVSGNIYLKNKINVPSNTKLFESVAHYSVFHTNHFVVMTEKEMIHTTLNDELTGYTILDCSYKDNVLMVSMEKDKNYYIGIFKQDTGFSRKFIYSYIKEVDSPAECNYIVLSNGVIIVLDSDEDMIITHLKKDEYKVLKDVKLPVDGILFTNEYKDSVLFHHRSKNYRIKMK